eukprot:3668801-Rhodomonas_salina.1
MKTKGLSLYCEQMTVQGDTLDVCGSPFALTVVPNVLCGYSSYRPTRIVLPVPSSHVGYAPMR